MQLKAQFDNNESQKLQIQREKRQIEILKSGIERKKALERQEKEALQREVKILR